MDVKVDEGKIHNTNRPKSQTQHVNYSDELDVTKVFRHAKVCNRDVICNKPTGRGNPTVGYFFYVNRTLRRDILCSYTIILRIRHSPTRWLIGIKLSPIVRHCSACFWLRDGVRAGAKMPPLFAKTKTVWWHANAETPAVQIPFLHTQRSTRKSSSESPIDAHNRHVVQAPSPKNQAETTNILIQLRKTCFALTLYERELDLDARALFAEQATLISSSRERPKRFHTRQQQNEQIMTNSRYELKGARTTLEKEKLSDRKKKFCEQKQIHAAY